MPVIIVFHPFRQFFHYGHRIRQVIHIHVVTLERFHERFSHLIALGLRTGVVHTMNPSEAANVLVAIRYVATAVISQPLNCVWQVKRISKALSTLSFSFIGAVVIFVDIPAKQKIAAGIACIWWHCQLSLKVCGSEQMA
jgi:hypothetical protein